jgi:hypothetical protein
VEEIKSPNHPFPSKPSKNLLDQKKQQNHTWPGKKTISLGYNRLRKQGITF